MCRSSCTACTAGHVHKRPIPAAAAPTCFRGFILDNDNADLTWVDAAASWNASQRRPQEAGKRPFKRLLWPVGFAQ
jgi:hypothetical protein